jgi:hypothetical protein
MSKILENMKWGLEFLPLFPLYPWYAQVAMGLWVPLTIYVLYLVLVGRPPTAMALPSLGERAIKLAREIALFTAQREQESPDLPNRPDTFWEDAERGQRYDRSTIGHYNQRFGGEVVDIVRQLRSYNLGSDDLTRLAEYPTNPLGLYKLARELEVVGWQASRYGSRSASP